MLETTILVGSIFQLIMIRMSLQELKGSSKDPERFRCSAGSRNWRFLFRSKSSHRILSNSFYNVLSKDVRKTPEIYFVGNSISSKYIADLKKVLAGKDFSINIISKSGTTTEPAIAFRVFKEMLIESMAKKRLQSVSTQPQTVQGCFKEPGRRRRL